MKRPLAVAGVVAALVLATPTTHAVAADDAPQLQGYIGTATGWVYSFQPYFPALLSTGNVPFETTVALSTAKVTSGGNSLSQAALFWPGSAAANLGPLLGVAAGQPFIGGLIPPFPTEVEASAKDGVVERSVPPAATMRAFGSPAQSQGTVRTPDVELPGVLRIDSVSSISQAAVTDTDVSSGSIVDLEGVSILGGVITATSIHSRSIGDSSGTRADADGEVQVVGLKVSGIAAALTGDGVHVTGGPSAVPVVPGSNPDAQLTQALKGLGVTLKLTRDVTKAANGTAGRAANAVSVSIATSSAYPGSRLDFTLAATGISAQASSPDAGGLVGDLGVAPPPVVSGDLQTTPGATPSDLSALGSGGGPLTAGDAVIPPTNNAGNGTTNAAAGLADSSLTGYHFKGVPRSLVVILLLGAVVIGRWMRGFLRTRLIPTSGKP